MNLHQRVKVKIKNIETLEMFLLEHRYYCYAIEEIFTSANMIITEFDKLS